jgi:VWFA-related protein
MRILSSAALFATLLCAQEGPVIRSTVRLVEVSVVALTKDRKPVSDLKAEDFSITEQGRAKRIAFFSVDHKRAESQIPLAPNVFSNRPEFRAAQAPSSVTVILLDLLNTSWTDQVYARQRVLKFLNQIQPSDRVGLYTLGRGLRVLHDFTTDTNALINRLNQFGGQALREFDNSKSDMNVLRELEERGFSTETDKRISNYFLQSRVANTLRSFEAIATRLAGVPGRKNLIWVSGSFPLLISMDDMRSPVALPGRRAFDIDQRTYLQELERAVRAMSQANVAVYPVDARGLMAPPVGMDSRGNAAPAAAAVAENIDTMTTIAERTGGKAYYNRNDLDVAVREIFDESVSTYTLGYYPETGEPDGKWRDIKVSVNRPGLTLRHRRGYFNLPERRLDKGDVQNELRSAIWSPVDGTSISINSHIETSGTMWKVMLQIDPSTIAITPVSDRWTGRLDVTVVARSADGRNLDATFDEIGMNLLRETYEKALKSGILYETQLKRRPDAVALKVAVRDGASGMIGTLTIPTSRIN